MWCLYKFVFMEDHRKLWLCLSQTNFLMDEEKLNQLIDSFLISSNFQQLAASSNPVQCEGNTLICTLCQEANFSTDDYTRLSTDCIHKLLNDKSHKSFYSRCIFLYFLFHVFCSNSNNGFDDVFDFGVITAIPSQIILFTQACSM